MAFLYYVQDIEFCDYELIGQQVCLIFNSISQISFQGYDIILYREYAIEVDP